MGFSRTKSGISPTYKAQPAAKDVAWPKVDAFRKYGGIRIEDDVVCTHGEPVSLTREAFPAVQDGPRPRPSIGL